MKSQFYQYIENLQDIITSKLEKIDDKAKFREDIWKRKEGGGGRTRIIENGNVFEKGGVNISRRTVAKYREILKIPSSNLRKRFEI